MTTSYFTSIPTYLQAMLTSLQSNGSKITDFNSGSMARNLFEAVATVLSQQSSVVDQLNLDSYLDTATGSALDDLAGNFIVTRLPAVQATGQVTITRQQTGTAMTIPAAWGQLTTVPTPGATGVAVVTTADATFAVGVSSATVPAAAVVGGALGNIASGSVLIPTVPVNGVTSNGGIVVSATFSGGVDAEKDAAFRARIPLVVQGRSQGTSAALIAAALGVPGVTAAGIIAAGSFRGDGSQVPAGSVEVYYRGSAGLLGAVQSAVSSASVLNQNTTAFASVNLAAPRGAMRCIVSATVYAQSGTDPVALASAITAALTGYFAGLGIGQTARYSQAVSLIHQQSGVVGVSLPLGDFRLSTASSGTAADIVVLSDSYANLASSDVTIGVNLLS